jgi:hypothetical protein
MENQEEGPIEDLIGGHAMSRWGTMDLRGVSLHDSAASRGNILLEV